MGDPVFHIVQKDDGEIEIVQLVQRFNCSNAKTKKKSEVHKEVINSKCKKVKKSQSHIKENCNCIMCKPILQEYHTTLEDETKQNLTKICVRKSYSRVKNINNVKRKEANATIINKSMSIPNQDIEKDRAICSSVRIKIEPEIEIMDSQDETELTIEKETINLQETSTFTEKRAIEQQFQKLTKLEEDITPDSTKNQKQSSINNRTNKTLFELTTKNIHCNICGIEFPKSFNQLQTLKTHFLQHKTSTNRMIKQYTGVKYITGKSENVEKFEEPQLKQPLILNKELKRKRDSLKQLKKNSQSVSDAVPKWKSSGSGISLKTLINLKKQPFSSLRNADFVIGNTVIKNLRRTTNKSTKRDQTFAEDYVKQQCKAIESDDDIEIVEQEPELIVIDDNDDDDKPKCKKKLIEDLVLN